MAIYKCKMCGGDLDPKESTSVVSCLFCGTKQTIAVNSSEKKANLFNRANALRLRNEFDKALLAYQAILAEFPDEAEAYWGIVLCRYGIEYVDDPVTKKKKPTIHRASFESIIQDVDYKNALVKADVVARQEYQTEAEEIAVIQKNILAISQKEDPFDVFICYKESDEAGKRTKDSVLAQQIYDELTEKGYKVFFSRVTLEKKIGVLYEPYIFAALNSAKIMVVVGTKAEYLNAVWVKNEWSRFVTLMSLKGNRYLIPCYGDMNAYDLPEEMLNFQAQDLTKLGFMQDLLRGIDKLMGRDAPKVETKEKMTIIQSEVNIPSLLKRSEILIGDGNYGKADALLEKVLDNDPTNSEAYLDKLLEDLQLHHVDELEIQSQPLDSQDNFQKAYQFGDDRQKKKLDVINQTIKDRIEEERLNGLYAAALALKETKQWADAEKAFSDLVGYRDAKAQAAECVKQGTQDLYNRALELKSAGSYDEAIDLFTKILTFQDSEDQIEECEKEKEEARKETIYQSALFTDEIRPYFDAEILKKDIERLQSIPGYKDSNGLVAKYRAILTDYEVKIKKQTEEKANAAKLKKAKRNRFLRIFIPSFAGVIGVLLFVFLWLVPTIKVNQTIDTINSGDYETALSQLDGIGNFGDTANLKQMCYAGEAFKSLDYETGIEKIYTIGGTVNVAFDGNGGTPDQSTQVIKKGKFIDSGANKEGYDFYGWILDGYSLKAKDHQASINLKASYEPIIYSITYQMNGIEQPKTLPGSYDIETGVTIPNVERYGYTFLGWTGTDLSVATRDYVIAPGVIGNKTYSAQWRANDYLIHLDTAGGTVESNEIKVTFDSAYSLPTPTYKGYDFLGWFDENQVSYSSGLWNQANDLYLTAHWNLHDYAISYALEGGTNAATNPATYTVTSGDIVLADPTRMGYSFSGWTTPTSSTPVKGYTIKNGSTGDLTFTANWYANTYTVTYDAGEGTVAHPTDTFVFDASYALPTPTRTGYVFAHWLNGAGPVPSTGSWAIPQNVTLTAAWSARSDITYVANYYGQNIADDQYTLMESVPAIGTADQTVTLQAKAYTGFSPTKAALTQTISPDGLTTFDFYYTRNAYTLSFVSNGGDPLNDVTLRYQQSLSASIVATRNGHTFGGWFDSYDQSQEFIAMPATNAKVYAWWSEETKACRFSVSFASDAATLNASNGLSGKVVVPSFINDCPVTAIGIKTFAANATITQVTLPSTVTSIGLGSFQNCSALITLSGTDNVTSLGDYVFSGCSSLLTLPDCPHLQTLGAYAFENCVSLTELPQLNNLTKIGDSTFYGCKALAALPEIQAVESIGNYAFYGCNALTHLDISSTVSSIGEGAFGNCFKLVDISFPFTEGHTFYYFFGGSSGDSTAISVSDNTGRVYYVSPYIKAITVKASTDGKLGDYTFYNASFLTAINLDSSLTGIGDYCFANCSGLTTVYLPDGLTAVGASSFSGCSSLQKLTVPFAGTSSTSNSYLGLIFGQTSYTGGYSANGYYVPSTLTDLTIKGGTLVADACTGMSSITTLTIENGITSIGLGAFQGCDSLVTVSLPFCGASASAKYQDAVFGYAFGRTSSTSSPEGSTSSSEFENLPLSLSGSVWQYTCHDVYHQGAYLRDYYFYSIPSSIRTVSITAQAAIPTAAFNGCLFITNITLSDLTSSIDGYAFQNCSGLLRLNSSSDGLLNVPSGVFAISDYCFSGCSNATEFTLSDSVESIGQYAFNGCSSVTKFHSATASNIEVPASCGSIAQHAFQGMSLIKTLTVPSSCESIGLGAFQGCDSLVTVSLPFCGASASAKYQDAVFGYAFGRTSSTSSPEGSTSSSEFENLPLSLSGSVWQYTCHDVYHQGAYLRDYYFYSIPSSIRTVSITAQAAIPTAAFNGCSFITSIHLLTDHPTIGDYAFQNCPATLSYDVPITEIQGIWDGTTVASSYESGTGTSSDPYLIYYPSQFVYFIAQINSGLSYTDTYFKLCSNLDLNQKAISSISSFAGHFIGNGRVIKNFTITGTSGPLGLFGTLSGSVEDLAITGFSISGTYETDESTMAIAGGFIGVCSGTISNCYAVGSITLTNKYGVTVGGLAGSLSGTATNCYANVSVSGTSTWNYVYAGGFAGQIVGTAVGCFASGNVTAQGYGLSLSQNGGFVGSLDAKATLTDAYRSSSQTLTRFGTSNSAANELGTAAAISDIVSWCKAHWASTIWNFHSSLPTLIRLA